MKLKNIFKVVFMMCFHIINSQTASQFSNIKNTFQPIAVSTFTIDLTKITSLQMLSKVRFSEVLDEDYNNKIFPENFNWNLDAFRIDSYKRMLLDFNRQDRYGHDLPKNINQDMINQIYLKNSKFGY